MKNPTLTSHKQESTSLPLHLVVAALGAFLCVASGCASESEYDMSWSKGNAKQAMFDSAEGRPPTPRTLQAFSQLLTAQGKPAQARFVLLRVIREFPDFTPAYSELAELYMRDGHTTDATYILSVGLDRHPKDAVNLNNRGMCYMLEGAYEKALEDFSAALNLLPREGKYVANTAVALGMLGRYEESIAHYDLVLPKRDAYLNMVAICEARNDPEGAARHRDLADNLQEA